LNSVYAWLSYDIVRFKIDMGVEEKCMCKNVTQRMKHGDWAIPAARLCRLRCHLHDLDLSTQFGVIILGLCYPCNLLFEYLASTFGLNQWAFAMRSSQITSRRTCLPHYCCMNSHTPYLHKLPLWARVTNEMLECF